MCGPEKWIKLAGTVLCEIFAAYTVIMLLAGHEPDRLALAFGTLLLVLLPMLLEKLFRCRICLPGYIDIGLTDSMLDMLLESLGALVTCLLLLLDKGRHPPIRDEEKRRCI